jgi:3-deoxy-D-arabino-heptulosonate 7-phosphate (DAHP) synthase
MSSRKFRGLVAAKTTRVGWPQHRINEALIEQIVELSNEITGLTIELQNERNARKKQEQDEYERERATDPCCGG